MKPCPHCGTPNDAATRFCAHCGASVDEARTDPLIGRTVGGAYLLQELIGVGGMGRVYRAEQNMLGRTVAVKVIHPHLLGDDQTVARFYNEARAASRLNHPNSVSIIDFGRTEDGILYLVMEHLAGKDLAHILAEEGPLPFGRICKVLRHVVSALGEAHALGVVHRDLKPENIIVRKVRRGAEQIKVVDFGLAHIVGPGGTSITTPGLVCGTPDYMAPEQGRGEMVDGRGDLYAAGVVLYEMLTDRLPYEADTPTKVVFKHIHEAIPDPQAVAPHRAIPDSLAAICTKALQKKREARFQSADELYEAIRRAEETLQKQRSAAANVCSSCGAANPAEQRFCGECGVRLTDRFTVPPSFRAGPPVRASATASRSPLVGRSAELERLIELRARTREASVCVHVLGEAGVGKSRLLAELEDRLVREGDVVAVAAPHPSGAAVPYWPIRTLVSDLLGVDDAKLAQLARADDGGDPLTQAGLAELLDARGLAGQPGTSRVDAVTIALAAAVRVAQGQGQSGRVALLVDDLSRCDALSAEVLKRLGARIGSGLFLALASTPMREPIEPAGAVRMLIRGLDAREAELLLAGEVDTGANDEDDMRDRTTPPVSRLRLPLYVEQVRALGHTCIEDDDALPPRLADVMLARLERLDVAARRLMQVVCVLGESAPLDWVRELSRGTDVGELEALVREGLVRTEGDRVIVCHPFVRELVESSIPAEHRKELHMHALDVTAGHGAPLEVRAEHAWRAAEPMSALLLLERMGDMALARGDGSAAVLAFRRGLELARRELMLTGETVLDRAIVTFSRKLGAALDSAGDAAGADGVLREALELAGPANPERAKMLLLLSRVATKRKRQRDATRFLGQALELAIRQGDRVGEAEAHLALGKLRLADGDPLTAANTLKKAAEIAEAQQGAEMLVVAAVLARAEALRVLGDDDGAREDLALARSAAERAEATALLAQVIAAQAALAEPERAAAYYREAATLAAAAGDADNARRWAALGPPRQAREVG